MGFLKLIANPLPKKRGDQSSAPLIGKAIAAFQKALSKAFPKSQESMFLDGNTGSVVQFILSFLRLLPSALDGR